MCSLNPKTLTTLLVTFVAATSMTVARSEFTSVPAGRETQIGQPVPGVAGNGRILLANEPQESAGAALEFDLSSIQARSTALARLVIDGVKRVEVQRAGEPITRERAAFHVFVEGAGHETLAGSTYVKPGGKVNRYVVNVSDAVNEILGQSSAPRRVRFTVRITGKPLPREVYALPAEKPTLELAPPGGWLDDWEQRVQPVVSGPLVYRESCLPLTSDRKADLTLSLLYPVRRVREVIDLGAGKPLQAGRDWALRDGKLVLPAGSHAPIQLDSEFFLSSHKNHDGTTKMVHSAIKLVSGTWYHEHQLEVSYEPATRDWTWPPAISTLDQLPRTRRLLRDKQPLTIILFGDSISEGYSSSGIDGAWPYQPGYGDLVVRRLRQVYDAPITFMNHARAGDTAAHAVTVADAQVAWFKPDLVLLAYGMNDRAPGRRETERANLEKIIDIVRTRSPHAEFLVITPMLNNPKQPTGLEPVKYIRDEERRIDRAGVAFVDITSTELAMLNRKGYLDLSGNGANHPNDFLHRIYAQRILEVLAPKK